MTNERCSESVREPGPWPRYHPCERRAVVFTGTEGWCKIHSPEAKAARAQKATERWQQQQAEIMAPHIRLAAVTARAGEMETLLRDLLEENARRYGYADSADAEREAREYEEEGRPLSAEQVRREVGLDRIAPLLSSIDQEKA